MSPNDGETAVRGCHSLGDMVVHMRAELGGDNPVWQTGQPTSVGHQTYHVKRDQIKMRDYMDRWVTPPKPVTSPTRGPPPPCKQALNLYIRNNAVLSPSNL